MDLGEDYGNYSVVKALSEMAEKGWLTYTVGRGEKKALVKFYKLSFSGIGLVLMNNPEDKLLMTLEIHKESIPEFETLIQMAKQLPHPLAVKLVRITGQFILEKAEKSEKPGARPLEEIRGFEILNKVELEVLFNTAQINYTEQERQRLKLWQIQHAFTQEPKQKGGLKKFLSRIS
jgi:hypothetical protein